MATGALGAWATLKTSSGDVQICRLHALEDAGLGRIAELPYCLRVLLEAVLRHVDGFSVTDDHVRALAGWRPDRRSEQEVPFRCARVVLQDFTGVPALVDLAAMRSAMQRLGGDPRRINPQIPADLVIDHSVQVDHFGRPDALALNARLEFQRNRERYEFLRWGQQAFANFRVVPPATGIVHQVNLEYLAQVVMRGQTSDGRPAAFPDTLVGTDSHTTMVNGLGVLGWGVGGIEAEAAMLGQPLYMLIPAVVGVRLTGRLREGATATDLVLRVTELLRRRGVVDKFVEFFGQGVNALSVADRATISNMAPEYGATCGFFPVDDQTLAYLRLTGRTAEHVDLVERYCKEQGLFRSDRAPDPRYTEVLELDLAEIEPSLAGPRRPQDRVPLSQVKPRWRQELSETFGRQVPVNQIALERFVGEGGSSAGGATGATSGSPEAAHRPGPVDGVEVSMNGKRFRLTHGDVVIAAITSCTNTSNPSVMLGAGLLARKAVERGLTAKPWVKTSLAPGSRVVSDYLARAGLAESLEKLGFHTVGYGCTTCIGNSGPLPEPIARAIREHDLVVCAVLSGNRNFEGRIHPQVRANYLASPPLVVAYALAGTADFDFASDPLGTDAQGRAVYLRDIWPTPQEVNQAVESFVRPEMFRQRYADVFSGPPEWRALAVSGGEVYAWREESTYIQEPPFFQDITPQVQPIRPVRGARCLALLGDSVTTDHISPAGDIAEDSPAGQYLKSRGVSKADFNSYGSRRGNDRVMTRGTFANVRLRNRLAPGTEGGWTTYLGPPDPASSDADVGRVMPIYDAAMKYRQHGVPLMVLAGKDYGMGSSRDWAAKGTLLLGVRAVLAVSFERIHRSNLVGMGVLPLEFMPGQSAEALGLTGRETFDIPDLSDALRPQQELTVIAASADAGPPKRFAVRCRIDTPVEVEYYRHGGVLHAVLRKLLQSA